MKKFFKILAVLLLFFTVAPPAFAGTKGGINIADHLTEFNQAVGTIGAGGWVYVMMCPGDVPNLNKYLKANTTPINLMIRGHYPGNDNLDAAFAHDWAQALSALDTKYKVYFMPVNEPNNGHNLMSGKFVKTYTDALSKELSSMRGSKLALLSPMIDPYELADHNNDFARELDAAQGGGHYLSQFDGVALALYGQFEGGSLVSAPPLKRGDYELFMQQFAPGKPVYSVETGTVVPGTPGELVPYGPTAGAQDLFNNYLNQKTNWKNDTNFKMFGIFSYNPDTHNPAEEGWVYNAPNVVATMRSFGGGPDPIPYNGAVTPESAVDWTKFSQCAAGGPPIPVKGDIIAAAVPVSKIEQTPVLSAIVNALLSFAPTSWKGYVKPDLNYAVGSQNLTNIAAQYNASSEELYNAYFQEREQHDSRKLVSATARECIPNPDKTANPELGDYIGNFISKERWTTAPVNYLSVLGEAGRKLGSFVTRYVQNNPDYRLPNLVVQTEAPLDCGQAVSADPRQQLANGYQGQNTFDVVATTETQNPNVQGDTTDTTCDPANPDYLSCRVNTTTGYTYEANEKDKNGNVLNWLAKLKISGSRQITTLTPFAHNALCHVAGCDAGDLTPVNYISDSEKSQLAQDGGIVASMYRNDAFDPTYKSDLNAKKNDGDQKWENVLLGVPIEHPNVPSANFLAARTEAGGIFGNCTLTNGDLQGTECNQNWTNETGTTPTATNTWNCNPNAPNESVAGLDLAGGQRYADKVYGFCASGTNNAWNSCRNDVIVQAKKACIDPLFALAIWLHESGASNYACGRKTNPDGSPSKLQDFGVNIPDIAENFSAQLTRFLPLTDAYGARCPKTMKDFISNFWFGPQCYDKRTPEEKQKIDVYIKDLNFIYATMAPGVSLPAWPKLANCRPS